MLSVLVITPTQIYENKKPFKKGNSSSLCQSWLHSLYDLQKENFVFLFPTIVFVLKKFPSSDLSVVS